MSDSRLEYHPIIQPDGKTIERMLKEVVIPSVVAFGTGYKWVDYSVIVEDGDEEGIYCEELSALIVPAIRSSTCRNITGEYTVRRPCFYVYFVNEDGDQDLYAEDEWSLSDAVWQVRSYYLRSEYREALRAAYTLADMGAAKELKDEHTDR